MPLSRFRILAIVLLMFQAPTTVAFSFQPMGDARLRADATLIVHGEVIQVDQPTVHGRSHTDYTIAVAEWFKGRSPARIVVRSLGSLERSPGATWVPGMPRYRAGEQGLWFLGQSRNGNYRILQFALGAFRRAQTADGRQFLVAANHEAAHQREKARQTRRAHAAFLQWLREPPGRPENYWRDAGPITTTQKFTLLPAHEGRELYFRWFQFDRGEPAFWFAHEGGYAGARSRSGDGMQQFAQALAVWSDAAGRVDYRGAGTTTAQARLHELDGQNTILWDDPFDEIAGSFDCRHGGALAIGAVTIAYGDQPFNGRRFMDIHEADVLTQDGAGCAFNGNGGRNGVEVFVHELGHTLGLGHACGDDLSPDCILGSLLDASVMRSVLHLDGRADLLGSDDHAALAAVYPSLEYSGSPPAESVLSDTSGESASGGTGWLNLLLLLVLVPGSLLIPHEPRHRKRRLRLRIVSETRLAQNQPRH